MSYRYQNEKEVKNIKSKIQPKIGTLRQNAEGKGRSMLFSVCFYKKVRYIETYNFKYFI